MARRTDRARDIIHIVRSYILVRVDCPPASHALVWRSPLQNTLIVRYGLVISGKFQELYSEFYDGADVPAVYSDGWDIEALQAFLRKGWDMPKVVDLRNAPRDEQGRIAVEKGDGHDTSRYQNGHETSRSIPSFTVDIKRKIFIIVMTAGRAVNRSYICQELKLKKTPWIISQIEELVEKGYLERHHTAWRNGCLMYEYTLKRNY